MAEGLSQPWPVCPRSAGGGGAASGSSFLLKEHKFKGPSIATKKNSERKNSSEGGQRSRLRQTKLNMDTPTLGANQVPDKKS